MNHEAKRIHLQKLIQDVRAEALEVSAGASVKTTSDSHNKIMKKVNRWTSQLTMIERSLHSDEGFLKVRYGNPRKLSFPAKQSLNSHLGNIAELRALAAELNAAISDLIGAMTGDDLAWEALAKAFKKIAEDGGDDLGLTGNDVQELTAIIEQADPGAPGPAGGGTIGMPITNLITMAIALFVILTRKKN